VTALLSIPRAADRLGISQTSVRRRIRSGRLRAQQQRTPQGYVWLVEAPDHDGRDEPQAQGDFRDFYIEHLEAEVASLRRIVGAFLAWREERP
jgi:hypothetical protein